MFVKLLFIFFNNNEFSFFPYVLCKAPSYQNDMYLYGRDQGDSEFSLGDSQYYYYGHCLELKTDRFGFPFFGNRHYKLYVRIINIERNVF